ncbi:hypothetical protein NIES4074_34010 [Cylindrospermum sp. NIES-4074]|nr:hypothetical protein NIES4074_34010 [Cylindrospermum sp. NIES-4074]
MKILDFNQKRQKMSNQASTVPPVDLRSFQDIKSANLAIATDI